MVVKKSMMGFISISKIAHSLEALFFYVRENKDKMLNIFTICSDFINAETEKIKGGAKPDGDFALLENNIKKHLEQISGKKSL